jgi:hypothetical protein
VYISFAPTSQCLTAPEIYKALNPKTAKFLIASAIYTLNLIASRFIVVVIPYEQVKTCLLLVYTYKIIEASTTINKHPLLFLGEGWGEVKAPRLRQGGVGGGWTS